MMGTVVQQPELGMASHNAPSDPAANRKIPTPFKKNFKTSQTDHKICTEKYYWIWQNK